MRPTRVRYWVIVFASTLAVITYVDRVCISFAAPAMQSDLGLSKVEMGWTFLAFGVAYSLFEIPVGFLGDRVGPRRVLLVIAPWWSFFTAATAWVWNLPSLLVTRALFGLGEAGGFPNLAKTARHLAARTRARAGAGHHVAVGALGRALTPPLVALVMLRVGWRHGLEMFGCLGAIWAALFYFWYRDNPLDNPKLNEAERELLRPSARLAAGHGRAPWGRRWARARRGCCACSISPPVGAGISTLPGCPRICATSVIWPSARARYWAFCRCSSGD